MAQLRESRLTTVLHILQSHLGQAVLGLLTGEPAEQSPFSSSAPLFLYIQASLICHLGAFVLGT